MCDIYDAKCEKCGKEINMHLGDFNTSREEIIVFCRTHIPRNNPDVVIWEIKDKREQAEFGTTRVGVLPLTENAKDNIDGNHPNACETERIP